MICWTAMAHFRCLSGITLKTFQKLSPRASMWPTLTVSWANTGWDAPGGHWEPSPTTPRHYVLQVLMARSRAPLKTQQTRLKTSVCPFQNSQREPVFLRGWTESQVGDRNGSDGFLRRAFSCPRGLGLSQVHSGSISYLSTLHSYQPGLGRPCS